MVPSQLTLFFPFSRIRLGCIRVEENFIFFHLQNYYFFERLSESYCTEKMPFFVRKICFTLAILFGGAISCASLFSNLVGDDEYTLNYVSTDDYLKSQAHKYILKSYFEKHGRLDDSVFQEFLRNGLPFSSCEVLLNRTLIPRLNVEERYLIGMGSHRRLFSSFEIDVHTKSPHLLPLHSCQLFLIERLPLGIFADQFELQHLFHLGVFKGVLVAGDTNIELPTIYSDRSVIEIKMDLGSDFLAVPGGRRVDIEVPLHARYPPLDERGYARVEMGTPDLLLGCDVLLQMKPHNQKCLLHPLVSSGKNKVVWEVPCGKSSHSSVVCYLTFFSSFFSAIIIALAAILVTTTHSKNIKQS